MHFLIELNVPFSYFLTKDNNRVFGLWDGPSSSHSLHFCLVSGMEWVNPSSPHKRMISLAMRNGLIPAKFMGWIHGLPHLA